LGLEPPPLVPYEAAALSPMARTALSPMARSFYRDDKRVSSRRIKEELGATLSYPDYQAGPLHVVRILAAGG
jgi:hypothetical protein